MRRRTFITGLGGTLAFALPGQAQQRSPAVVGYLTIGSAQSRPHYVAAFKRGLNEANLAEGRDFTIEHRWAGNRYDELLPHAEELVRRKVDVIMAGSNLAATAAKRATSSIPIVFSIGSDPIAEGLVASYNRPGGNATGVAFMASELGPKRLELLGELMPGARIAVLVNARRPNAVSLADDLVRAGAAMGRTISIVELDLQGDLDRPFVEARNGGARALLIRNDPVFNTMHTKLAALTLHHRMPAMFFAREFVEAGGFASYSANIADLYRQAGRYVARILAGAKPADLPVVQPTRFELVVNLKTAKALGLEVPPMLLARADEVIE